MKISFTLIFLIFAVFYLNAQEQSVLPVINKSSALYLETAADFAAVYSGKQEPKYSVKTVNHPYLDTQDFVEGTLSIDGCVYTNIPMRLNHEIDELAVLLPNKLFSVIIPHEHFDYAIIGSLYIIYNKAEDVEGSILQKGYFVRLYDGHSQVWKSRRSVLTTRIVDNTVENFFEHHNNIYVLKDGTYFPVNSKRSTLKLFASKKKEIKRNFKQLGLKYGKDPETAVIVMAAFYDSPD